MFIKIPAEHWSCAFSILLAFSWTFSVEFRKLFTYIFFPKLFLSKTTGWTMVIHYSFNTRNLVNLEECRCCFLCLSRDYCWLLVRTSKNVLLQLFQNRFARKIPVGLRLSSAHSKRRKGNEESLRKSKHYAFHTLGFCAGNFLTCLVFEFFLPPVSFETFFSQKSQRSDCDHCHWMATLTPDI